MLARVIDILMDHKIFSEERMDFQQSRKENVDYVVRQMP